MKKINIKCADGTILENNDMCKLHPSGKMGSFGMIAKKEGNNFYFMNFLGIIIDASSVKSSEIDNTHRKYIDP